jgi:hypothetical protein
VAQRTANLCRPENNSKQLLPQQRNGVRTLFRHSERNLATVAKLAKSLGGVTIPKVSATFATTKCDTHFSDDARSKD